MSLFKSMSLIRRRKTGGGYVRGQWIPGELGDTEFKGTWQPASGKTLELLPEGKRSREVFKCFAPLDLDFTSADAHGETEADSVIWQGKEYEVTTAALWNNGLMTHWELLCTRPKEGAQ
ncbi:MAG: hypothetical protein LBO67_04795 [Spirochaetaceae bacterium]|jgi:hypothetical protein|nr:hypothetical protein [Spirochaetaceae bacterium]